ncbi:MAG: hypothetical protein FWE48_06535 [Coriobacteriia bacterium]|nr:hypothetical protein [Coriobacteriia bacterium]
MQNNTFEQPTKQKKRLPAWAVVLITIGVMMLLGLCCLFSLFTFAQDYRDEILLDIGEFVIMQTYSQTPEEAMERVRPDIRIDPDVLEVIVGEYRIDERYSGDLFSDSGEYIIFDVEKGFSFALSESRDKPYDTGVFSAERIILDEFFERTCELERETMLFLDSRLDTDWYHIVLYGAAFYHGLGYEAVPVGSMFMSIVSDDDIIFYRPGISLTAVARTVAH